MIQISDKSLCSGCGACLSACPVQCITMKSDEEGFLYPFVDRARCLDCGICEKICPVQNRSGFGASVPKAYAAVNTDEEVRRQSSSGGLFTLLARQVLEEGGAVFGAAYDDDLQAAHICLRGSRGLDRLRVSKYVQSRIGDTFAQAKSLLEEGVRVLFTGTPCQIAGLYAFLGRDYDNLLTHDIVCHGVPSPMVWKAYLDFEEKKSGKRPVLVLRTKRKGWRNWHVLIRFGDGSERTEANSENLFMCGFLSDLYLRPICHHCPFKGSRRPSDLTLADFWGIEEVCPEMDDGQGTSLVLVHSQKGQEALDCLVGKIKMREVDGREALKWNRAALESCSAHPKREKFFDMLRTEPFDAAAKTALKKSLFRRCGKKVYLILIGLKKALAGRKEKR